MLEILHQGRHSEASSHHPSRHVHHIVGSSDWSETSARLRGLVSQDHVLQLVRRKGRDVRPSTGEFDCGLASEDEWGEAVIFERSPLVVAIDCEYAS